METKRLLIFFLDTSTIVEYKDHNLYSLSRYGTYTRLLGFAADFDDAKSLILLSFSNVSKIITISSIIKFNKKLL